MVPDLLRHIRITDYTYRSVLGHRYSKVPLVLESTCVVMRLFMAILPSLGFIELTNAMYGTAYRTVSRGTFFDAVPVPTQKVPRKCSGSKVSLIQIGLFVW